MFLRKRGKESSVTDYCGLGRDPEGFVVHHIDQCIGKFISYFEQGNLVFEIQEMFLKLVLHHAVIACSNQSVALLLLCC